jgi:NADH:ubiquinone oxidoreductase subunit D
MVRMEEMRQSIRIIEQALDQLPGGPVNVDDTRYVLPDKQLVYTNIEALMQHFKNIFEGIQVPPARSTRPPKRPTASSGSISSAGEGAGRTRSRSGRRASRCSRGCRACARDR